METVNTLVVADGWGVVGRRDRVDHRGLLGSGITLCDTTMVDICQ